MNVRAALRIGLTIGLVAVLLALTGVLEAFEDRAIIRGVISLNALLIFILAAGAGAWAGWPRESGEPRLWGGPIAGAVVGVLLAALGYVDSQIDLSFTFPNLSRSTAEILSLGLPLVPGLALLIALSAVLGWMGSFFMRLPNDVRRVVVRALASVVLVALLADQIDAVLAPADAVALGLSLLLGYWMSAAIGGENFWLRLLVGAFHGALIGLIMALIADGGGLADTGILRVGQTSPLIVAIAPGRSLIPLMLIFSLMGTFGAVLRSTPFVISTLTHYGAVGIAILALLGLRPGFDVLDGVVILIISLAAFSLLPQRVREVALRFETLSPFQKRLVRAAVYVVAIATLFAAPLFLGAQITNILNLVGIYAILGIGLNIVVGNAGLLDLGYAAFFALGAYVVGALTTPNALTCGALEPVAGLPCSGMTSFWVALLAAVGLSGAVALLLGIPVIRLRADYFAIVTLAFGEIFRLVLRFDDFSDLFGTTQGIANIPRPVIDLTALDPALRFTLNSEINLYYVILSLVFMVIFIAARLGNSRIGRAWRAVRADEQVAQASGIRLNRTKLFAFVVAAGFAGLAGAVAATRLFGAYPDSFGFQVTLNVLSLVIIGGVGSIPGVIVGALLLIGLPEVLRELADYRLIAIGILLIFTLVVRPQGIYSALAQRSGAGEASR